MFLARLFHGLLLLSAAGGPEPATQPQWLAAVSREVAARGADDRFSGVALVAREGKTVLQEARGFADVERRAPITLDTRFNLGSMNKMFTAVAIAQLAQAGKLRFEDTIGRHLPYYPNKDAAARVTVHQLLTHTSGIGNIFGPAYEARRDALLRVADYMALFAAEPLRSEPGARFEYSNGGYIVLGAIVERVSGQSYDDYVRRHIFEPAGMTHSGALAKKELPPDTAAGITKGRQSNFEHLPGRGSPAGGGYSTAADLVRFSDALLGHRLLSGEYTDVVLAGKAPTPRGKYGYGFSERFVSGKRVVGHNGGFPGVNAELHILPETREVVVVLSNYDPPAATQLAEFIVERVAGAVPAQADLSTRTRLSWNTAPPPMSESRSSTVALTVAPSFASAGQRPLVLATTP
jgi:CubicO group peptidase (beta-lactamase class C family)